MHIVLLMMVSRISKDDKDEDGAVRKRCGGYISGAVFNITGDAAASTGISSKT